MRAVVVACHVRVKAPLALSDPRHRSNMLADYPHDVSVEFDNDVYTQSLRAFYHDGSIAHRRVCIILVTRHHIRLANAFVQTLRAELQAAVRLDEEQFHSNAALQFALRRIGVPLIDAVSWLYEHEN